MSEEQSPAVSGESFSREYVESLKAQIEQRNEETAKLRAFKATHDEKQRAVISKLQPDINEFVTSLTSANPDHAAEMAAIVDWSKTCHESNSLESAMPLARVISCASMQFKRTRDEASQLSEKATSLGATMKELEDVKADRDAKTSRIAELENYCQEQQAAAEKMQNELAKAGVLKDKYKFDFSQVTSREAKADAPLDVNSEGSIIANRSEASRSSLAVEDQLLSFVSLKATSSSNNRVSQSKTAHALLGASSGSVDDEIASAIRGF